MKRYHKVPCPKCGAAVDAPCRYMPPTGQHYSKPAALRHALRFPPGQPMRKDHAHSERYVAYHKAFDD